MNGIPAHSDRPIPAPAYVVLSTMDALHARKLAALAFGIVRRVRIRIGEDETVYELWLDRMQPGVLTVFPPDVNGKRVAIKVLLDGMNVSNGHCTFRAFASRDHAIGYFRRHDGTLENVDDGTRNEIVIEI